MEFYTMEQFEIKADAIEEVKAWEDYEADMAEMDAEEEYDEDYIVEMYNDEVGFDPYLGCYDFDC